MAEHWRNSSLDALTPLFSLLHWAECSTIMNWDFRTIAFYSFYSFYWFCESNQQWIDYVKPGSKPSTPDPDPVIQILVLVLKVHQPWFRLTSKSWPTITRCIVRIKLIKDEKPGLHSTWLRVQKDRSLFSWENTCAKSWLPKATQVTFLEWPILSFLTEVYSCFNRTQKGWLFLAAHRIFNYFSESVFSFLFRLHLYRIQYLFKTSFSCLCMLLKFSCEQNMWSVWFKC